MLPNNYFKYKEKKLIKVDKDVPCCSDLAGFSAFVLRERNVDDYDLKVSFSEFMEFKCFIF